MFVKGTYTVTWFTKVEREIDRSVSCAIVQVPRDNIDPRTGRSIESNNNYLNKGRTVTNKIQIIVDA